MDPTEISIERKNVILASSYSETKELMELAVAKLNGLTVEGIEINGELWDTIFRFSDGYIVRTFSVDGDDEQWKLKTPSGKHFIAGPGTSWELRP